jgi:multidrug resistance efflux pump
MRKRLARWAGSLLFLWAGNWGFAVRHLNATDLSVVKYSTLAHSRLQRAQQELDRVKQLIAQGTLPKSRLAQAQLQLDDVGDEVTLAETLYSSIPVADFTTDQAKQMLEAAQRRVDRESVIVEDRRKLLDTGVIARSEFDSLSEELESRKRVLSLAQNRVKLLADLKQMAETEKQLERAGQLSGSLKDAMIRYDGNGLFGTADLTTISSQFQKRFGQALPISALGQTLVHQAMGLDHRNRVDVALNPETSEGLWLRQLLEKLHIPYLAFRSAVAGAATAPHIHIGTGSSRLKLASR